MSILPRELFVEPVRSSGHPSPSISGSLIAPSRCTTQMHTPSTHHSVQGVMTSQADMQGHGAGIQAEGTELHVAVFDSLQDPHSTLYHSSVATVTTYDTARQPHG